MITTEYNHTLCLCSPTDVIKHAPSANETLWRW